MFLFYILFILLHYKYVCMYVLNGFIFNIFLSANYCVCVCVYVGCRGKIEKIMNILQFTFKIIVFILIYLLFYRNLSTSRIDKIKAKIPHEQVTFQLKFSFFVQLEKPIR